MDTDPGSFPGTNRPDLGLRVDPLTYLEGVDGQERQRIDQRHGQIFGKAVAGVGPPPCTHRCPWLSRCKYERLACAAFSRYVINGRAQRAAGEVPTRERYERLFGD
jgi:hypothetical protein